MLSTPFTLELAGVPAGFIFTGAAPARIRRRYFKFQSRKRPAFLFEVRLRERAQSPYRPVITSGGGRLRLRRGDFDCLLDARSRAGLLECRPAVQSFDAFLRAFYSRELLRAGGLMLHSAGLVRGGRAYLFPGKSGSGKSTLSRLAARAGAEVISDELNLVRPERGRFFVHGSPFWGELRAGGRPGKWPLGGLFLPEKGGANALSACGGTEALRTLLRCTVNFSREAADAALALDNSARLLAGAPRARLEFTKKNAGFMEYVL